MSVEPFVYDILDSAEHIRVIRVDPDLDEDGNIICSLSHATGDMEYGCLSYMWEGVSGADRMIIINGKVFAVRRNLYDFLHRVRTLCPNQPLWIDAMSLNQMNDLERNTQVQRMCDIYAEATRVYAWLGVDSDLDYLFAIMEDFAKPRPTS